LDISGTDKLTQDSNTDSEESIEENFVIRLKHLPVQDAQHPLPNSDHHQHSHQKKHGGSKRFLVGSTPGSVGVSITG
jgi:hypothetical protein